MRGDGDFVAVNFDEAFFWLKKAADQGNYAAQRAVSDLYFKGEGNNKNDAMSRFYANKAAEQKRDAERAQDRDDRIRPETLRTLVIGAALGADFW